MKMNKLLLLLILIIVTNCAQYTMMESALKVENIKQYEASGESAFFEVFLSDDVKGVTYLRSSIPQMQVAANESLKKSQLCTIDASNPDYKITAFIIECKIPFVGFSFNVETEIKYDCLKENKLVFSKTIRTNHTTTVGEAFSGDVRVRKSIEGSYRKNIDEFIAELSSFINKKE